MRQISYCILVWSIFYEEFVTVWMVLLFYSWRSSCLFGWFFYSTAGGVHVCLDGSSILQLEEFMSVWMVLLIYSWRSSCLFAPWLYFFNRRSPFSLNSEQKYTQKPSCKFRQIAVKVATIWLAVSLLFMKEMTIPFLDAPTFWGKDEVRNRTNWGIYKLRNSFHFTDNPMIWIKEWSETPPPRPRN